MNARQRISLKMDFDIDVHQLISEYIKNGLKPEEIIGGLKDYTLKKYYKKNHGQPYPWEKQ